MDVAAVELDFLKLRVSLMEEILMRVWVSELATTQARTRDEARQIAIREVQASADAIRGHMPSAKGAFALFDANVGSLKALLQTVR